MNDSEKKFKEWLDAKNYSYLYIDILTKVSNPFSIF